MVKGPVHCGSFIAVNVAAPIANPCPRFDDGLSLTPTAARADRHGDREIVTAFRDLLVGSHYPCLRQIECDCERGVLTLRGAVPRYYLMQVLQQLTKRVRGVQQVLNLVDVVQPKRRSDSHAR